MEGSASPLGPLQIGEGKERSGKGETAGGKALTPTIFSLAIVFHRTHLKLTKNKSGLQPGQAVSHFYTALYF
ncbi:MAG: hypothetical protein SFU25_02200 [Candidatus Caenarcaniphilales bacterium]|nr:hypothetical protein [Candidatus Caenarcaniphilales bacterium]